MQRLRMLLPLPETRKGETMPRWLILLIAILVILLIAILWVTHVHVTVR